MNQGVVVNCPKCGADVPITEGLAAPMVAKVRAEYEVRIEREVNEAREQARKTAEDHAALQAQSVLAHKDEVANDIARRLVAAEARESVLSDKLAEAQQAQAAALRKERELADRERELDLTVEQRVTEAQATMRSQAKSEASEEYKLQLMQSEQAARELREQIEDLKRKAQESNNRLQGEVQELDLEATLRATFIHDEIVEVAKGINGADCSQLVRSVTGADCGVILYESKRTKNWSAAWLPKLRDDMRRAKAHIAVLVTQAMPPDTEGFDNIDGVWVTQPKFVVPLATAMRETLVRVHAVAQAQEGMKTKAEEVYTYVCGPQFRHRVEALVEAFTTMREDLEQEKRAMLRQWSKREAQIDKVLTSTTGMFGDLQGISGKALSSPDGLALPGGEA